MRSLVKGRTLPWTRRQNRWYSTGDTEADIEHVPIRNGNGIARNAERDIFSRVERSQGESMGPLANNTPENITVLLERYIRQIQSLDSHPDHRSL